MRDRNPSYRKKKIKSSSGKTIYYAVLTINRKDVVLGRWNTQASGQEYNGVISEWLAGGKAGNAELDEISVTEVCVDYVREMKTPWGKKKARQNQLTSLIGFELELWSGTSGGGHKDSQPGYRIFAAVPCLLSSHISADKRRNRQHSRPNSQLHSAR